MTVLVSNEVSSRVDLSGVLIYGDIKYVNHRHIFADECKDGVPPRGFTNNIDHAVDNFNPATDYVLIAGDPVQTLMIAAAIVTLYGGFRALRYEKEAKGYVPFVIGDLP